MLFFFFNDTATTEIYTLSLHDALPISEAARQREAARCNRATPSPPGRCRAGRRRGRVRERRSPDAAGRRGRGGPRPCQDRKSTRLNSSHANISYAVFCLKKKNIQKQHH